MKRISNLLSENFQFLVVQFSIYLNRNVFVMGDNLGYFVDLLQNNLCFERKHEKNIIFFI